MGYKVKWIEDHLGVTRKALRTYEERAVKIEYFTIETLWMRNVSPERFLLENRRFSQAKSREKHPKNAPVQ